MIRRIIDRSDTEGWVTLPADSVQYRDGLPIIRASDLILTLGDYKPCPDVPFRFTPDQARQVAEEVMALRHPSTREPRK